MQRIVFLICLIATAIRCYGEPDVLYWQVTDNATVDGEAIQVFLSLYPTTEDEWSAVRVRVTGGNLSEIVYLGIYAGAGEVWDGTDGVELGDNGSGYWGAGVPTGVQSPFEREFAEECLFAIELGHNVYDAAMDVISWETLAETDDFYLSTLHEYLYTRFDLWPPTTGIWTPDMFHSPVPEPKSGLLIAIGISFLALRRKKRNEDREEVH